jgi:hypothetical protein
MADYSKYIAPERRSVLTPLHLVENGKCVFGTFDKEFETMDFLEIRNPTSAPDLFRKLKLTLWEAVEVHLEEGLLLTACCDMGIFGQVMNLFYDKRKKKVYSWAVKIPSSNAEVAGNLLNGSETKAIGKHLLFDCINDFQDGKCCLKGWQEGAAGRLEYDFQLTRLSDPSIVSIPLEDPAVRHRPVYTQKDFFRCSGWLKINGETFTATETATAIVDDHKAYYPRKAHFDWVSTMGVNETDGERKWFAINLTRNQSIDQEKYNENLIWLENETSLLPPVEFTRDIPTLDFKDGAKWTIQDEHDMVNVTFHVYDIFRMVTHAKPLVNIEYFVAFGELEGYVRDESGKKYLLDGMVGIGEDKTLLL